MAGETMDAMRRLSVAAVACGFLVFCAVDSRAQCHFADSHSDASWTYRFQAESRPDGLVLHVTARFPLGPSGVLSLQLPAYSGKERLHSMTNLRTTSAEVRVEVDATGGTGVLRGEPNGSATIAYDLSNDWTGPLVNPLQFHPVLMAEYFELTGHNALVFPQLETPAKRAAITMAQFDFGDLPSSWTLATSFGAGSSSADRCQVATVSAVDIVNAVFAAGDFRLRRFSIGRQPAVLAIRGTWTFSDDDAISQIEKTVGVVRDFWKDNQFPYFLVTLKPFDRDGGSSDGSAFTNAFWMYLSRRDSLAGLLPLLAHESFHAWNPLRMGLRPNGEQIDWFTDGFTDYYASRLLLQVGVLSVADYIDSMNRALRIFPLSSDPYVRGRIIGLWLDATITRESHDTHSLDDVMFEMIRTHDQPLTQARIFQTIGRYLSPEAQSALEAAVTNHAALAAPNHPPSVIGCARPSLVEVPTFDLGFDFAASRAAGQVIGVRADSAAYAAGLREGQILTGRTSVANNDPQRAALIGMRDDAGERVVEFFPKGVPVEAWQYQVADCAAGR
jgi:predicted metalloprotease with PDZ domain